MISRRSNKQSGFVFIIVVVFLVVLICFAGIVLARQNKINFPVIPPVPSVTPTAPTPTVVEKTTIKPETSKLLEQVTLSPGQTVKIINTDLSITLSLMAIPAGECFDCPAQFNFEVKSQGKTEQLRFSISGMATEEVLKKIKTREIFGFRIIIQKYGLSGVTFTVERL